MAETTAPEPIVGNEYIKGGYVFHVDWIADGEVCVSRRLVGASPDDANRWRVELPTWQAEMVGAEVVPTPAAAKGER